MISDKILQVTADGTTVSYYNADVITAKNHYPFGMQMPDSVYKTDGAYFMNGTTLSMDSSYTIPDAANNFTIEFWAKPAATHQVDPEGYIWGGIAGQRYLVAPGFLAGTSEGMGVSVGTNGVSVYEHGPGYIPALLVWQSPSAITDWIHVAVVYQNKQPKLYINGQLVRTGLVSSKQFVYPSFNFMGYGYGAYLGYVDEMRIWKEARTQHQIKDNRYGTVAVPQTNLSGYWPLSASNGSTLVDISGNNRSVPLNSNTGRLTGDVGGNAYRYGFNEKENDNDAGAGIQDYGMRIYSERLGRFLSTDPLTRSYPMLTPYQFASNRPIDGIDRDGLEYARFDIYLDKNNNVTKIVTTTDYELKNNGSKGAGIEYSYHAVDGMSAEYKFVKNIYGIYQGGDNPKLPIVGKNYKILKDDYSLKPINETDANAKQHDLDYDVYKLAGLAGIFDKKSTKANEDYIKRADKTIQKYNNKKGELDEVTGKPVTKEAKEAAEFGKKWFRRAEDQKKPADLKKPTNTNEKQNGGIM